MPGDIGIGTVGDELLELVGYGHAVELYRLVLVQFKDASLEMTERNKRLTRQHQRRRRQAPPRRLGRKRHWELKNEKMV